MRVILFALLTYVFIVGDELYAYTMHLICWSSSTLYWIKIYMRQASLLLATTSRPFLSIFIWAKTLKKGLSCLMIFEPKLCIYLCFSSLNQKPLEFTVEEGGMFYQFCIYERQRFLKINFHGKRKCKEIAVQCGRTDLWTVSWSVCKILLWGW